MAARRVARRRCSRQVRAAHRAAGAHRGASGHCAVSAERGLQTAPAGSARAIAGRRLRTPPLLLDLPGCPALASGLGERALCGHAARGRNCHTGSFPRGRTSIRMNSRGFGAATREPMQRVIAGEPRLLARPRTGAGAGDDRWTGSLDDALPRRCDRQPASACLGGGCKALPIFGRVLLRLGLGGRLL